MSLNLTTKQTIDSVAFPGVRFVVRNLSVIQRAKRDLALLDTDARVQALQDRLTGTDEKSLDYARINQEIGLLVATEKYPAILRAGIIAVEGLEIDGRPATVDDILSCPDQTLFFEAIAACYAASGLSAVQEKNSQQPGTSLEAKAGPATPTTADTAGA